jgi:hypothetical protein
VAAVHQSPSSSLLLLRYQLNQETTMDNYNNFHHQLFLWAMLQQDDCIGQMMEHEGTQIHKGLRK